MAWLVVLVVGDYQGGLLDNIGSDRSTAGGQVREAVGDPVYGFDPRPPPSLSNWRLALHSSAHFLAWPPTVTRYWVRRVSFGLIQQSLLWCLAIEG